MTAATNDSFPSSGPTIGTGVTIVDIDKRRGRGMLAVQPFEAGDELYAATPDIAVLYSDHVKSHCARCFRGASELSKRKISLERCTRCEAFAVCAECCPAEQRSEAEVWAHHQVPCEWYVTLPEGVRAGDTDYVRFLLEYAACAQRGDVDRLSKIMDCCSLENEHSNETKKFAEQYAAITANQFGPHGLRMPQEGLKQVLLKVKANALGFPFDARETLGWAMEGNICAVNHSCTPNAALQQDKAGLMVLRAIAPISAGEEVTISYVHVPDHPDVKARRRVLLDKYRFLCMCPACAMGTPPSVKGTPVKRSPEHKPQM